MKKLLGGRKKWFGLGGVGIVAAGAAALLLLGKRKYKAIIGGQNVTVLAADKMKYNRIPAGQPIAFESYRVIAARRPNMNYVKIVEGQIGGKLTSEPPAQGGTFTRNVISEGGVLYAEFAA